MLLKESLSSLHAWLYMQCTQELFELLVSNDYLQTCQYFTTDPKRKFEVKLEVILSQLL